MCARTCLLFVCVQVQKEKDNDNNNDEAVDEKYVQEDDEHVGKWVRKYFNDKMFGGRVVSVDLERHTGNK